mgnify:CR=1 FL=1|tara:strand:+ start:4520 stop:4759 length:240 start_codon:yes stop_codon:yes gene_type:complete
MRNAIAEDALQTTAQTTATQDAAPQVSAIGRHLLQENRRPRQLVIRKIVTAWLSISVAATYLSIVMFYLVDFVNTGSRG